MVRVEETLVEDATKLKTPNTTADRRRPIDLPEVEENDSLVLLAGPPRAGVRRCEGPAGRSSHAEKTREPFPLMVHEQTDPAGQFCAGTLSPCAAGISGMRHKTERIYTEHYEGPYENEVK